MRSPRQTTRDLIVDALSLVEPIDKGGHVMIDAHDKAVIFIQFDDENGRRIIASARVEKAYRVPA